MIRDILCAMSAKHVRSGTSGPWVVQPCHISDAHNRIAKSFGVPTVDSGLYTRLAYYNDERRTMYDDGEGGFITPSFAGETVMIDHDSELRTHLEFVLRASGRVLVCGLGLGCVVRGLLAKDDVEQVDVVERDDDVLSLVAPYMPRDRRLRIHQADARFADLDGEWAFAGHDLWSNPDRDEPHLHVLHCAAMIHWRPQVACQLAWQFPRRHRRSWARIMET